MPSLDESPVVEAVDQMELDRINYEYRKSLNVGRRKQPRRPTPLPPQLSNDISLIGLYNRKRALQKNHTHRITGFYSHTNELLD